MRSAAVAFLVLALAVSCQGAPSDREDIAGSKDTALATFLQPLEAKWRDDQTIPERRSRELSYFGTGYSYHPYGGHHNPLYTSPYSQQALYSNPYSTPGYGIGGLNGYGGAGGGLGGLGVGGGIGYLGTGAGGYPGAQFGYSGFGQGAGAYPYGGGFNVGQSPYGGGYGTQLGGYYNRGLYV
ncbi:keratin-3, type I cytoskeletal 51 kDa-like [Anopheles stephensi]|uniref:keratin-3, type I cytoskeletal 51 kDa-like n=1 Tax=Anopheles stephensi TaxID=30069 RepID=UPI001658718A|nr:keratin-3, type I cytoskeletal 51 kDa-like [Anopheles stephensi]